MIPRYTNPEMSAVWSDANRYQIWLEIEKYALEGMANEGIVPKEAVADYSKKAKFSVEKIQQIEAEVKHDVIAFLTNVAEYVGPNARFVHRGMTSSDLLDTCLAVQLMQSGNLIQAKLTQSLEVLKKRALEFQDTPCIGRTHGVHAEPVTFGLKVLGWYTEFSRYQQRLEHALKNIAFGKISGPVGTYAGIPPSVEKYVLGKLALNPEPVATQVVPRDRHAEVICALAGIGTAIDRVAVEIRHLHRTEVAEALEGFSKGQKGSSAMPHKRNTILSENLSGLARLLRSYVSIAFENCVLWHERDISHSSAERVIFPDAFTVLDFMLGRFNKMIADLEVRPERMLENLELSGGTVFSGHVLLALTDKGVSREDAYRLVQKHALGASEGGPTFMERLIQDSEVSAKLTRPEIENVFNLQVNLRHVSAIFKRVLG